ncbi:hypothetical protein [Nocardioides sp.]|uniref:hypothetical protein n=1 Tax=Nocardioides sp. TaxID=35761 RepID=UPI002ED47182
MRRTPRLLLLVGGCVVLGIGVALLLTADLGSDGFSTLVNGVSIATGMSFLVANVVVSVAFLALAAARRVVPGIGTVVQVVVVGGVASLLLDRAATPSTWPGQTLMLAAALPVIGIGITAYLGSRTGAGPAEAAGLAWDPPVPFRWSYSAVQGGGALGGWLLGATIGPGTIVVIVLLGPLVDLTSRVLRLDVHQGDRPTA